VLGHQDNPLLYEYNTMVWVIKITESIITKHLDKNFIQLLAQSPPNIILYIICLHSDG